MSDPTANGETVPAVEHVRGNVWVGGRKITDCHSLRFSFAAERALACVRARTPDDWWRSAAAIQEAMEPHGTGGPLGAGVDFLADELDEALPADVRQAIQEDAYEAAREVILEGIADHLRRMAPAAAAVSLSGGCST